MVNLPRQAHVYGVLAMLALIAGMVWTLRFDSPRMALAQQVPFDCSAVVTDGGFENPQLPDGVTYAGGLTNWSGSYDVIAGGTAARTGRQYIHANSRVRQELVTSNLLAGDTVTVTAWHNYTLRMHIESNGPVVASTISEGGTTGTWTAGQISYTLIEDAQPLTIQLDRLSSSPRVDDVTATCTRAVAPTETPTPTQTPSPTTTSTPTQTPSPTATTEPTATSTPTGIPADPIPDTTIQVIGDPRFPIVNSAVIPGHDDLAYTLETPPGIGTVVVDPSGSFVYTVPPTTATGATFTVLATAPGGETAVVTVTIIFEIDKTIPNGGGTVVPGGTGGGGDATDARSTGNQGTDDEPDPTSVPSGGRIQQP
jgi:hypothetical protein